MCDEGMLDYQRIQEGRVLKARIKREPTTRAAAISRAAELLRGKDPNKVAIVLSAEHSQEDNAALLWLGREVVGTTQVFVSGRPEGAGDDILINSDKNPNSAGVAELVDRVPLRSFSEFESTVDGKALDLVIALGSQVPHESNAPSRLNALIALASHEGPWVKAANVLLPASSWAESDGTFVNAAGLTQESEKAITRWVTRCRPGAWWRSWPKSWTSRPAGSGPEDVRVSLSKIARTTSSPPAPTAGANG
jgi:NADH-quinone oxidoreductase subunit G